MINDNKLKTEKPGKVREFKSGQGKLRGKGKAKENVFLHVVNYSEYCS